MTSDVEGGPLRYPHATDGVNKMLSVIALVLAVVALLLNSVIPGPVGIQGVPGQQGPAGQVGSQGSVGPQGLAGPEGLACWDLNGNGVEDGPTEDTNGGLLVNV